MTQASVLWEAPKPRLAQNRPKNFFALNTEVKLITGMA
jgi:hypothetical protein